MGHSLHKKSAIKFFVFIFFIFPSPIFGAQFVPTISYQTRSGGNRPTNGGSRPRAKNIQQNSQSAGVNGGKPQIPGGNSAPTTTILPFTIVVGADNATTVNCDGPRTRCYLNERRDFNPILSGGIPGQSGIKARLNPPAFQYLSEQFAGVLNYRIKRSPLPPISQCLPQVQGCIRIPNLHITNYHCTNNVHLHPAPPNQLILDANGMDVSVEGNLGGQVTIMVPLALYGRIHADAYRVHVRVGIVIVNNGSWPALQIASCSASVGHLQMDLQNGGLLGDIARQQLQAKLTRIVRQQFSRQICSRLPQLLNQEVNSKIPTMIPDKMSLNALVGMAIGSSCISKLIGLGGDEEGEDTTEIETTITALRRKQRAILNRKMPIIFANSSMKMRREINATIAIAGGPWLKDNEVKIRRQQPNEKEVDDWITSEPDGTNSVKSTTIETTTIGGSIIDAAENTDAEAAAADADAAAAANSGGGGVSSFLPILTSLIDLTKFENIYLNFQYLNSEATQSSYTIGIRGGFSVCGWGCTPFGPFPMQIPPCGNNCKMTDVLISDFTLNTLLYHLNRVDFFLFNITPDTPEIGKLMSLNCEQSYYDDSEDSSTFISSVFFLDENVVNGTKGKGKKRARRQDDDGGSCMNVDSIVELGFCIGSLLPAAKSEDEEKGGNEKVDLKIRTDRAPDAIIRSNGTIALEFSAFLDFFAHSTGKLITTFHVDLVLNVNVQIEGDDYVKATLEIAKINVRDVGGKSGMGQDVLDTLINLMSEKILECANSIVEKGCKIEIPEGLGGLPLNLSNLKIGFVEHALHLQTDFKLSEDSDVLGGTEPCTTMKMKTTMRRNVIKKHKMN